MPAPFDPICLFEVLAAHDVDFIVIGGMAAVLHGSPTVTVAADVVPSLEPANLQRLSAALTDLDARIRTPDDPEGIEFSPHPALLASVSILNLTTRCGDLDLTFTPAAIGGYDEIASTSERFDLETVVVCVARLDDIIESKRAADRPKDRAVLPILEALREELKRKP
jgi:hypothetical protein